MQIEMARPLNGCCEVVPIGPVAALAGKQLGCSPLDDIVAKETVCSGVDSCHAFVLASTVTGDQAR